MALKVSGHIWARNGDACRRLATLFVYKHSYTIGPMIPTKPGVTPEGWRLTMRFFPYFSKRRERREYWLVVWQQYGGKSRPGWRRQWKTRGAEPLARFVAETQEECAEQFLIWLDQQEEQGWPTMTQPKVVSAPVRRR